MRVDFILAAMEGVLDWLVSRTPLKNMDGALLLSDIIISYEKSDEKTSFLVLVSTNNHKCFLYNKIAGLAKNFFVKTFS